MTDTPKQQGTTISLRRWKLGAVIACVTGLATGVIGLAVGMPWKGALLLLAASMAKDFLLWQAQHPAEAITFDTEQFTAAPEPQHPQPQPETDKPKEQ